MNATALLADLRAAGIAVQVDDGQLRLTAERGALTPELLAAAKDCKQDLLKILPDRSLLLNDPGGSGSCVSPSTVPDARVDHTTRSNKVDAEFDRFARVAVPMADGSGWFDPTEQPVPVGVPIEAWQRFERDCGSLGRKKKSAAGGGIQIQSRIIGVTNRGETT